MRDFPLTIATSGFRFKNWVMSLIGPVEDKKSLKNRCRSLMVLPSFNSESKSEVMLHSNREVIGKLYSYHFPKARVKHFLRDLDNMLG